MRRRDRSGGGVRRGTPAGTDARRPALARFAVPRPHRRGDAVVGRRAGRRGGGRRRRPTGAVRVLGRGDLVPATHAGGRTVDRGPLQRPGGSATRDRGRPRAGRPQQRPLPALSRRARRHRTERPRRPDGLHDRQRHLDQRGMELGRPLAHRQRAVAERRTDRHPTGTAGSRDAPRHVARRHGGHGAPPRSRVLVQQRARFVRRQHRQRGGLGDIGRDDGAGRARPPGAYEPLRVRRDAPIRGRSRVRAAGRPSVTPAPRSCSPHSPTAA